MHDSEADLFLLLSESKWCQADLLQGASQMVYDLVIIGNDEAGIETALAAAESGKSVAVVMPEIRHSPWVISETLQQLIKELIADGDSQRRGLYAAVATPKLMNRLLIRHLADHVMNLADRVRRLGGRVCFGEAAFTSPTSIQIASAESDSVIELRAGAFIIATGVFVSRSNLTGGGTNCSSEGILGMLELPKQLTVAGGGDFGAAIAAYFSIFGVSTTLRLDESSPSAACELAQECGVRIRYSDITEPYCTDSCDDDTVILNCGRMTGHTSALNLGVVGVETDERGRLWCNDTLETWCRGIFGAGDVVGFSRSGVLTAPEQAALLISRMDSCIPEPHFHIRNRVSRFSAAC